MYTPKQFQESIDWNTMNTWGAQKNSSLTCRLGQFEVLQFGDCEHETCYETHEWMFVFGLGDQRFARNAEYSSYDGLKWVGDVFEVAPVEVVKTGWVLVKPAHWTAKELEKILTDLFKSSAEDTTYRDNYKAPEQDWETVTITSWAEFAEHVENGTLRFPALRNLPITQVSRRGEFELSSGVECVFTLGNQLFMKTGTWYSEAGANWSRGDLFEVEQAEKTVGYWKTVK